MEENRRNFFRINDTVGLLVLKADTTDSTSLSAHLNTAFSVTHELESLEKEAQSILRGISGEHKEVGQLFRLMNKKIDLLAKTLIKESTEVKQLKQHQVCLSEASIDFESEQVFEQDESVLIKLMLLPDYIGLDLTGRVLESHAQSKKTVIEFTDLDEYDRQVLARHIIQAQSSARRTQQQDESEHENVDKHQDANEHNAEDNKD